MFFGFTKVAAIKQFKSIFSQYVPNSKLVKLPDYNSFQPAAVLTRVAGNMYFVSGVGGSPTKGTSGQRTGILTNHKWNKYCFITKNC